MKMFSSNCICNSQPGRYNRLFGVGIVGVEEGVEIEVGFYFGEHSFHEVVEFAIGGVVGFCYKVHTLLLDEFLCFFFAGFVGACLTSAGPGFSDMRSTASRMFPYPSTGAPSRRNTKSTAVTIYLSLYSSDLNMDSR